MKISVEARFWAKIDKSGGPDACWIWTACRLKDDYGQFWDGRKPVLAHRFAYELAHGPIPEGLHALHRCDNPPCANPAHLFLVVAKNRQAHVRGERHGSRTHTERLARGERHGRSKLTESQVVQIRAAYAAGGATQTELGRMFGVDSRQISRVVRGKHWKCVGVK